MSTATINRRNFLKISVTAGGGLVLGFNWLSACSSGASSNVPAASYDLNAFIKIDTEGLVTIMAPNPEIGQGVKTSLPMIVAEELDVPWEKVSIKQAGLDTEKFRRQVAGGSHSVKESWEPFRKAGATGRQMLINAAASEWKVDPAACTAENGMVIHTESGKELPYGDLVEKAATLPVPEDVPLKDPADFKLIGQRIPNYDNKKIVTGRMKYGIDTKREGMLYANIMRPPAFGQKLQDFDDTETRKLPGVVNVVSFDDKIAVLGKSTWEAMQGAKALKAEWKTEGNLESTEALKGNFRKMLESQAGESQRKDGDINQTFASAAKVFEAAYEAPFLPHNTMEPMNFFAHVKEDEAELYGPTQLPANARGAISKLLDMPEENITVGMTRMGGGFGRRLMMDFVEEAAMTSKLAGAPVNVIRSREDDMGGGFYRPMTLFRYRAAIDGSGKLTGWHHQAAGIGSNSRPDNFPAGAVPNLQVDTQEYESPVTTAPWRAPGHNFVAYAEGAFLDEIAHGLGKDPVAFKLELLKQAKKHPVGEVEYDPDRYARVVEKAAEMAGWGRAREGIYQGFAAHFSFLSYVAQVAELREQNGKLKVSKVYCAVDCGIVVNMSGAETEVEGGIIDGLGHAMYGDLTLTDGKPDQTNFNRYRMIRMQEAPEVEIQFIKSNESPTGLGEPGLPPTGAAVANAIFAATGKRVRSQPFVKSGLIG